MIFAIELGVAMILSIPITYIIIHLHKAKDRKLIFGDKLEDNKDDHPLLLTIQAMESELSELKENNIHMERIAQLEKDIEEANKQAEALSKVANDYGSTMEEVGESISEVKGSEFVVGGIKSKGLIVNKVSSYEGEIGRIVREHQEENRKIIEQLDSNIKNTIQEAFEDNTKPDWQSYVKFLEYRLSLMSGSSLPNSITEDMSLSEHKRFYDFIYEHDALGIGRQFNNKATYSIKTLATHLSLEDFTSPMTYANKAYDLLIKDKQDSYGVYLKVFEEDVFDLGVFRNVILSYFEKKDEPSHTILFGQITQELEKDEQTRKEEWLKNEQDKTIRETKELLRKVDKSIHKAEYGKLNTIPKKLSHEERVKDLERVLLNEIN